MWLVTRVRNGFPTLGSRQVLPGILLAAWLAAIQSWSSLTAAAQARPAEVEASRSSPEATTGVVDLDGRERSPFEDSSARAVVLIFISIDCPVSNRYAPEIQRLQRQFSKLGVAFWLIQPSVDETPEKTRQHLKRFGYSIDLLRDPRHALVGMAGARITPEVAVFAPGAKLVYHGRIDDRQADDLRTRPAPTKHELRDALEALLAGRLISVTNAPAVGCRIPRLPP